MEPLAGIVVADFTRYLPGPFASRELLQRGARVVRVEAPGGDPMRDVAPGWHEALNAGKESVVWDLERNPGVGLTADRLSDMAQLAQRAAQKVKTGAKARADNLVIGVNELVAADTSLRLARAAFEDQGAACD